MSSILSDLYHGRIYPLEQHATRSTELKEINRKIEFEKQYFTKDLSSDDYRRFEAFENLYMQSAGIENVNAFSCGFKLAVKMMTAVFSDIQL
ncbi:MAG: hypothetical protein IJO48_02045 [Clostridia bacterium]|nr:hypothetical protein [Clostridia bacterium]